MTGDPNERPGGADQEHGDFAEGEDDRVAFPEEERVGRFSEGQEEIGSEDPEKLHHGRFSSEDQEDLPEEDPEKHREGRFSEGQDSEPPNYTP